MSSRKASPLIEIERQEEHTAGRALRRPDIDMAAVLACYRRYAPTYDLIFGPMFQRARRMTIERINRCPGQSILEVGVGTGLSLPRYLQEKRIVGIDVSTEMLAVARRRVERMGLHNVAVLAEMDAERLSFDNNRFDAIAAMHVMSVTPDPRRCLDEMRRVVRSGGSIFICNHFTGKREKMISPALNRLSRQLGWRPDFSLERLIDGSALELVSVARVPILGLFKVVHLRKP